MATKRAEDEEEEEEVKWWWRRRRRVEKLAAVLTSAVPTHRVQLRKPLSESRVPHPTRNTNTQIKDFTSAAPPPAQRYATVNPQLPTV